MTASPSVVFFQQDLRLTDNPALAAAVRRRQPLICLFVWNPEATDYDMPGAASRWWLHHSLQQLAADLQRAGNGLVLRLGTPSQVVSDLITHFSAVKVFWNQSCEPAAREEERKIQALLEARGLTGSVFHGNSLVPPQSLATQAGRPYCRFTPFWKRLLTAWHPSSPLKAPSLLPPPPAKDLPSESLSALQLLPSVDWAAGLLTAWHPGEQGALAVLKAFVRNSAITYTSDRDRPDLPHTSRLSPHLHFGEISPGKIWHALTVAKKTRRSPLAKTSYEAYFRQLGWREFARYLLYYFPHTPQCPLTPAYQTFPWDQNPQGLRAWQRGQTGYPIVDAGMRELWKTGWMHNRVRMIVGSFLTKDLLLHWGQGAEWFWDTLVDADLANNTMGWQWVAGCGADASPFFRIFNPVTQGTTFDPDGQYVRQWVPELAGLPSKWIHHPWEAPASILEAANVQLGATYPYPMVDHASARNRALAGYRQFQKQRSPQVRKG